MQDKNPPLQILILILTMSTLAQVAGDIYVPSLPAIRQHFYSSSAAVQLTLTLFMLGLGISQLVYGPISDRIGRRLPILIGIGINLIGTVICLFSLNIIWLIVGRLMQGIGLGGCHSVGRSVSRDLLSGDYLAKFAAQMGMITAFVIAGAPMLGGYLQYYFGWRSAFLFILIYSSIILLLVNMKLPETNQYLNQTATDFKVVIQNYWMLLKNKVFLSSVLCSCLALAGILAYLAVVPFLLNKLGLSSVAIGWWAFIAAFAIFFSALTNNFFVIKKGIRHMIVVGTYAMLVAGLSMIFLFMFGLFNVWVIMLPVILFIFGAGLTFANAFARAFHPFPKIAGAASALFGCLQICGGFLGSSIMTFFKITNQLPLAMVLTVIAFIAFVLISNSHE